MTIILFLFVLSVLVFVHELGHFITAKISKMRVDEFAIGFPPRIFGWKKGETTYALNLIPFGGYVKIHGENPDDESLHGADSTRSFTARPRLLQVFVLLAGVSCNVIFAWLLMSFGLSIGMPVSTDFLPDADFKDVQVLVTSVRSGTPAQSAGLLAGDELQLLQTGDDALAPKTSEDVQKFMQGHGDDQVTVRFRRFNADRTFTASSTVVVPREGISPAGAAIGIGISAQGTLELPAYSALYHGARLTYGITKDVAVGLFGFIGGLFKGESSIANVTGPVGIARLVGDARALGFSYLISFVAFISVNLAVINLLPFPALDGGRILFVLIESVIRRPIPARFANTVNATGFILLLCLMAVITYRDVVKLFF